jgi:hypothetical protein
LRVCGFTVSKKEFQNGILLQNRREHPPLRLSLFNLPITVESGVFTSRHCYRDDLQMIEEFLQKPEKRLGFKPAGRVGWDPHEFGHCDNTPHRFYLIRCR